MKFFYHYNKPSSKKAGKPQISLHFKQTCYIVDNIVVGVPTAGRINKRQPYFVMVGNAATIEFKDNIAYIT